MPWDTKVGYLRKEKRIMVWKQVKEAGKRKEGKWIRKEWRSSFWLKNNKSSISPILLEKLKESMKETWTFPSNPAVRTKWVESFFLSSKQSHISCDCCTEFPCSLSSNYHIDKNHRWEAVDSDIVAQHLILKYIRFTWEFVACQKFRLWQ